MNIVERKSFDVEIKAADDGSFEAVIATLDVIDSDGDIIAPGAFDGAVMSVVPAHDHSSVPLGKARMEDRGNLAIAKGQFNLDIQAAKDWRSALKFDLENPPAVQEWSFAFRVMDSEEETRDGEPVRILKRMDVMEVSPVLRGAGVNTTTLSVKSKKEGTLADRIQAVRVDADAIVQEITEAREERVKNRRELSAETCTEATDLGLSLKQLDELLREISDAAQKATKTARTVTDARVRLQAHKARWHRTRSR